VAELVGPASAQKLLSYPTAQGSEDPCVTLPQSSSSPQVYLEPTITPIASNGDRPILQVILRDVTKERSRQEGLKAYAAHVIRGQEEERKRIAQELHDDAVQVLILLCRRLDTVESAAGGLPPPVTNGLREARRSAEEVLQQLRGFAKALRPPILEDLGLVTSVRRLLVDLTERTRVEGRLKVVGDRKSVV
jgi:signal transduction histidine kinase